MPSEPFQKSPVDACIPLSAGVAWQRSRGQSLVMGFLASAQRHPTRPAVRTGGQQATYAELAALAGRIGRLLGQAPRSFPLLGAILGDRGITTYAGLLGTLLSGAGNVPLNPRFPRTRNLQMLELCKPSTLVLEDSCLTLAEGLLGQLSYSITVVAPTTEVADLRARYPLHRFFGADDVARAAPLVDPPCTHENALAYILFTSGSTGVPKGVMLTHRSIGHYLRVLAERHPYTPDDHVSQTADVTWDVSMHDMYLCWGAGACLYTATVKDLRSPGKYIRDNELTIWYGVPSIAILMKQLGTLKPNTLPSLRVSWFAGEAMPFSVAEAWQEAAPNSIVENIYGPTEAAVNVTADIWRRDDATSRAEGFMSCGHVLPGMSTVVVDEHRQLLPVGTMGELCLAGPHLAQGYWGDEAKTKEKFVTMPWYDGPDNRWYRTGDLAIFNADGRVTYKGRMDDQVKVRGFRVELLEIEHVLKQIAGTEQAAVLAYPVDSFSPTGTRAFVCGATVDKAEILKQMAVKLPDYMVPQHIYTLEQMPLNTNGKVDKQALKQRLKESTGH